MIRELTEKNIGLIQKLISRGSVVEVKVEQGQITVIEVKRKKSHSAVTMVTEQRAMGP